MNKAGGRGAGTDAGPKKGREDGKRRGPTPLNLPSQVDLGRRVGRLEEPVPRRLRIPDVRVAVLVREGALELQEGAAFGVRVKREFLLDEGEGKLVIPVRVIWPPRQRESSQMRCRPAHALAMTDSAFIRSRAVN